MMTQEHTTARNLTERDAARFIGMSKDWLRASRRSGRGPTYQRLGRAVRYAVADLEQFIDAHRIAPQRRPA